MAKRKKESGRYYNRRQVREMMKKFGNYLVYSRSPENNAPVLDEDIDGWVIRTNDADGLGTGDRNGIGNNPGDDED